jgi:flagellar biosynthesis chaperone FliJ
MGIKRKTLQDILSDPSLLKKVKKENNIDYSLQMEGLISRMKLFIDPTKFNTHVSTIFSSDELIDLIGASYRTESDRKNLLIKIAGISASKRKVFSEGIVGLSALEKTPVDDLIKEYLSHIIYDPTKFCDTLAPVLPGNLIQNFQFIGSPHIGTFSDMTYKMNPAKMGMVQEALLSELMKKNSTYRNISLLLGEDLLFSPGFNDLIPELYCGERDEGNPDEITRMQQSRFKFGLMTSHMGTYQDIPKGKLRYLIEKVLELPLNKPSNVKDINSTALLNEIKKDLERGSDVPLELQTEVQLRLMQGYLGMHSSLVGADSTIKELEPKANEYDLLDKEYQKALAQVEELSDKFKELNDQQVNIRAKVTSEVTSEYETQLKELEGIRKGMSKLSKSLNHYKEIADEKGKELSEVVKDLKGYQSKLKRANEELEYAHQDLIIAKGKPIIDVDINASIVADAKGKYKKIYETAVGVLSVEPLYGRIVQTGSKAGKLHDTLAKSFAGYADKGYRIINAEGAHRVICSTSPTLNNPTILLILTHTEYEKYCDGKK